MPTEKAVDPYQLLMEVWKHLGEKRLKWFIKHFNVILRTAKMPTSVQLSISTRTKEIFKITRRLGKDI